MKPSPQKLQYIYWFASYHLDSPSVRYRAQYPLAYFKQSYNVDSVLIIPSYKPFNIIRFIKAYISALFFRKKNSIIVVQRVRSRFIYANLLKLLVTLQTSDTIYDLDDADYLAHYSKTIHFFIRKCSAISAGSNAIHQYASQFNKRVWTSPSPTPDLKISKKQRNPVFTIGWLGGFSWGHKDSLVSTFFPALKDLPFDSRLVIVGVREQSDFDFLVKYFKHKAFKKVKLEIPLDIDWKDEVSIQDRICDFDVGIATLSDTEFQRSKSGIKVKQYLNNGIPVLSTDLPENNTFVQNGVNGFLCNTAEEFQAKILDIYSLSDEEYWNYSKNARDSIALFDHDAYCKQFYRSLNLV